MPVFDVYLESEETITEPPSYNKSDAYCRLFFASIIETHQGKFIMHMHVCMYVCMYVCIDV